MSETMSIVPFGKYKGQPIDVLRQDQEYLEWLSQQDWFRKKFATLYNMLLTEPSETPEHNRYQALFLDQNFAAAVFDKLHPGEREAVVLWWREHAFDSEHDLEKLKGEVKTLTDSVELRLSNQVKYPSWYSDPIALEKALDKNQVELDSYQNKLNEANAKLAKLESQLAAELAQPLDPDDLPDITVKFETRVTIPDPRDPYRYQGKQSGTADVQLTAADRTVRIEIKPAMGDDYPAVLRQMQASRCDVLYLVAYTGEGANLDQVKQMFEASRITVLMHDAVNRCRLFD